MNVGEKIVELRKENGYTRVAFAEKIGIPHTTLRNYETGVREPGHLFLIKIADEFNVTVDYLLGIENRNISVAHPLLLKYNALDERGQKAVDNCLNFEYEHYQKQSSKVVAFNKPKRDPELSEEIFPYNVISFHMTYFDTPVSAGTGQYLDYSNVSILKLAKKPPRGADFIVRVSGDSMEPTYSDGDKLFIKKQDNIKYGDIGIFYACGNVYVKEYGREGLVSHNKNYDIISCNEDSDCKCLGKVIGIVEE